MEGGGGVGRVEVGSRVYRRKEMVSFVAVKRLGDGWEGREGYWTEGGKGGGCVAVGKPGLSQEKECFLCCVPAVRPGVMALMQADG